jgi:hypothetical protein
MDESGFVAAAPCDTEALLGSVAQGAVAKGVKDVKGA